MNVELIRVRLRLSISWRLLNPIGFQSALRDVSADLELGTKSLSIYGILNRPGG